MTYINYIQNGKEHRVSVMTQNASIIIADLMLVADIVNVRVI